MKWWHLTALAGTSLLPGPEPGPASPRLLPAAHLANGTGGKLHNELFQEVFQRKGWDSATQLLHQAAEPPAMLMGSSSCSAKAAGGHWPPRAFLCCHSVASCPSPLNQTPQPSSAALCSCSLLHCTTPSWPSAHNLSLFQLYWIQSGTWCFGQDLKHTKKAKKLSSYIPEGDLTENLQYIAILARV